MVGFGGTCTASPSLARRAVVVRSSGQGPRGSGRSKDHLARRASETTSDAEAFDQERARERRIEEKFRGKSSARGSVRRGDEDAADGGEEALPLFEGSLLPEPKEALESYSSSYRVRQPGVQPMSPEEPRAPFPSSSAVAPDEPVYVKRRGRGHGRRAGTGGGGRSKLGAVAVASVGGLVCALSLLSHSGKQTTQRTIDSQQLTMSTLQSEVDKGTDKLFGHHRHVECERSKLVPIQGAYRTELLRPSAARAFEEMQADARRDGVALHLVSGFRSVGHQEDLYFGVKAERAQSSRERAMVSAPPGFSEHHTGYALDICDETLSLDESFASTRAYRWLQRNARSYNFELSFPQNGEVTFEPWHWRFEGETEAIEQFYGRD